MKDYSGFIILVLGTLFSLFIVWFGLRQYGLSRPLSNYQTPLVKKLKDLAQKEPLIWSDHFSGLRTSPVQLVYMKYENETWKTSTRSKQEIGNTDHYEVRIAPRPTLVMLEGGGPQALPLLRDQYKRKDLWKNMIFCSRSAGLMRDLRELEPQWTFCSDEAFLVRMLAFSSLALEPLIDIKADVFFIHLTAKLQSDEIESLIREGHRQNKFVIIGPVSRPLDGLSPDGWMVEEGDQKVQ